MPVQSAADLSHCWLDEVKRGIVPEQFKAQGPFGEIDINPGRICVIAGQPGAGKTAAVLQLVVDMLRVNPDLNCLIANVEMHPSLLWCRILARLSGVPLKKIELRQLSETDQQYIQVAAAGAEPALSRLYFASDPTSIQAIAQDADQVGARLLILDYLQRICDRSIRGSQASDDRGKIDSMMNTFRTFADKGAAVIAVSALSRNKDKGGSSYSNPSMANLRGSSEIEFGADSIYMLSPDVGNSRVHFHCEKNRYGEPADITVSFDGRIQRFEPIATAAAADPGVSWQEQFDSVQPAPSKKPRSKGAAKRCDD